MEQIDIAVTDLNGMNMFLEYNWLIKYNLEVNWNTRTIRFIRCLRECKIRYQDITFISKTRRLQPTDDKDKR